MFIVKLINRYKINKPLTYYFSRYNVKYHKKEDIKKMYEAIHWDIILSLINITSMGSFAALILSLIASQFISKHKYVKLLNNISSYISINLLIFLIMVFVVEEIGFYIYKRYKQHNKGKNNI